MTGPAAAQPLLSPSEELLVPADSLQRRRAAPDSVPGDAFLPGAVPEFELEPGAAEPLPTELQPGAESLDDSLLDMPPPTAAALVDTGPLTLDRCIDLARANNVGFLRQYQALLATHANLERARSPFGPQADATLNLPQYSEFRDVEENVALSTRITEDRTNFLYRGQLRLSQRLRNLGQVSVTSSAQRTDFSSNLRTDYQEVYGNVSASYSHELLHTPQEEIALQEAELDFRSARYTYDAAELQLEGEVTTAYYDLVEAIRQLEIESQRLEQSRANLELAQRKFEIGLIAEVEALRLRVTMLNSEANYAQAQTRIERQRDVLREVLGMGMDESLEVVTEVAFKQYAVDAERALAVGLRNRTDMLQAEITEQLRRLELQDVQRRNGINATLNASVSLMGRGDELEDISRNLGRNYWDVGIQVTMPVLDSGNRRGQLRGAEINVKQAELTREGQRQAVILQIRDAVRNVREAERQITLRQASLEVSERTYQVEKSRFELGLAQSQELLNAQADLTTNRIGALDAIISYQRQLVALQLATMADLDELVVPPPPPEPSDDADAGMGPDADADTDALDEGLE